METFFVRVNKRYLVKIEIAPWVQDGRYAAEHHFLDGYHWVWDALAFSAEDTNTDTFRSSLLADTVISETELADRIRSIDKAYDEATRLAQALGEKEKEVKRLRHLLQAAEERLQSTEWRYGEAEKHFTELRRAENAQDPREYANE